MTELPHQVDSKIAASASDKAIHSYEQIAAEVLEEADRLDPAEDDIHAPCRGDELPDHVANREGRRAWLREAKQRLDRERAERAEPIPRHRKMVDFEEQHLMS